MEMTINWTEVGTAVAEEISIMDSGLTIPILGLVIGLSMIFARRKGVFYVERFYTAMLIFGVFFLVLQVWNVGFAVVGVVGILWVLSWFTEEKKPA